MNKFYIASSFKNSKAVTYVASQLVAKEYLHTYDWTKNTHAREIQAFTLEDLKGIGQHEKNAIMDCDFLVVLLPGGNGTHIELGIALGQRKKIFLYSEDGAVDNLETTSTFYHLPEVEKCYGTLDDLINKIMAVTMK